jgi:U1 small nuclear ribonucleoprotein 70kDa
MTHLLPPNLLKLFAARPPLPYSRPVGKNTNRVCEHHVDGIAAVLAQVREEQAMKDEDEDESKFTLCEEVKRQVRKEERAERKTKSLEKAKESCQSNPL